MGVGGGEFVLEEGDMLDGKGILRNTTVRRKAWGQGQRYLGG